MNLLKSIRSWLTRNRCQPTCRHCWLVFFGWDTTTHHISFIYFMAHFQLSAQLVGHEKEVRAVSDGLFILHVY